MYIYIYNEKPLHILEMHDLKKVLANTTYNSNIFLKKKKKKSYNLNYIILIIFNCTHAYA